MTQQETELARKMIEHYREKTRGEIAEAPQEQRTRTPDGYRAKDLKMFLEALDTARVVDYEQIIVPGFSYLQLKKTIRALKQIAARAWYAEATRGDNETQSLL